MKPDNKKQRRRVATRILALASLGLAIAMTVVKITGMIQYDVDLKLRLSSAQQANFKQIEMDVFAHPDLERPLSITVFRSVQFGNGTEQHRLRLPIGKYRLVFRLLPKDQSQTLRVVKEVEVDYDKSLVFDLP